MHRNNVFFLTMRDNIMLNPFDVTIGVCIKNCEKLITSTIKTIRYQDYPHHRMEIIFIDDGSKDETYSIIKKNISEIDIYSTLYHHEWKGLGFSRNFIVNKSNSRYIIWVDGDMLLSKDFVRTQVDFMEKNPSVAIGKGKYGMYPDGIVGFLENIDFIIASSRPRKKGVSTPLGTGGSIYNVEAIRQVGGFNQQITGSGEDADAENRLEKAGWLLSFTSAIFVERRRKTWASLWNEYIWHGKGGRHLFSNSPDKHIRFFNLFKMLPPIAISSQLRQVADAYRLTHRKTVVLLPFHYIFKRMAWIIGFING